MISGGIMILLICGGMFFELMNTKVEYIHSSGKMGIDTKMAEQNFDMIRKKIGTMIGIGALLGSGATLGGYILFKNDRSATTRHLVD